MSYAIYYPYSEHAEDIEVLTFEPDYTTGYEEDEYYEGYMTNKVHILQYNPSSEEVELVKEFVENVDIIYINPLDVYAIAIDGCGMNLGPDVEMAYLIVDGESPIKEDPYYFSDEKKEWLRKLREDAYDAKKEMMKVLEEKREAELEEEEDEDVFTD